MRGAALSRLLCFVTLRGTLKDLSGEVGAVNHSTARYIHKPYLCILRGCWVLWKDSLLCRTTCIIPPMSHAITHILIPPWHWHAHSMFWFLWPKRTQFSLFSGFSETGTWLILYISSTPYVPQPRHSGHCMVAFTILKSLETCNRISLLLIKNLLGVTCRFNKGTSWSWGIHHHMSVCG